MFVKKEEKKEKAGKFKKTIEIPQRIVQWRIVLFYLILQASTTEKQTW